jgi:hypothetical protein
MSIKYIHINEFIKKNGGYIENMRFKGMTFFCLIYSE